MNIIQYNFKCTIGLMNQQKKYFFPRDLLTRRVFFFCLENGLETRREVHRL